MLLVDLKEPGFHACPVTPAKETVTDQVLFSSLGIRVSGDHEAHCLVEHVDLVRFQVLNGGRQLSQQLRYKWLCLPNLQHQTTISNWSNLNRSGWALTDVAS